MAIKTPIGFEDQQPAPGEVPPPTYSAATSGAPSNPNPNADLERDGNHHPFSALNGAQPKPQAPGVVQFVHPQWGPTPLRPGASPTQWGEGLPMPVYDPNSQHSLEMAGRRARSRFFRALFWALMIWLAVGLLFGGIEADIQRWSRRRHGHY